MTRGRKRVVPLNAVRGEVCLLIARAAGKPCPTSHDLAEELGVGERLVYAVLETLSRSNELEIRYSLHRRNRRMRVKLEDGAWSEWTDWTARNRYQQKPTTRSKLSHVAAVLAKGGYR
jgi:hypothetical protein